MSSIILGIDASNIQAGGGLTHLVELLRAANPNFFGVKRVVVWAKKKTLSEIEDRDWLYKVNHPWLEGSLFYRILWQRLKLKKMAEVEGCNLLFVPGGSDVSGFKPIVTMNQNLLPFEYKELSRYGFSLKTLKFLLLRFVQGRTFKEANGIIFLTSYAKNVVLKIINRPISCSAVVPHGVNAQFLFSARSNKKVDGYNQQKPCRVLYVSTIDFYKHQWQVVRAIAQLRLEGLPVVLDLVGSAGPAYKRLQSTLNKVDPNGAFIRYHGEIPYKNLNQFYELADIGVFASSCETFGQILTEMMAMGLPIACSSRSAMPEVLGDAGIYFDPENPRDIADALRKLICSPDLCLTKAKSSFDRAQVFSWERCANETFEFLRKVALSSNSCDF